MSNFVSIMVTFLALAVSIISSYIAWSGLKTAKAASRAATMQNLFIANQAALQYPELLIDVHGVDTGTSPREARALAYLSVLLDGFQEVHGRHHRGNFRKMAQEMKLRGDSLRRLLAVPENAARWGIVRTRSYGDFEPEFADAVDDLIAYERQAATERNQS
jgi:hypothetical protein